MAKRYNQGVSVSNVRFTQAPMGEIEFSKMYGEPTHTTSFNAGHIIPIYCNEVLPHDTFSIDVDSVVRQATLKVPSMDRAIIDIFAYFVPNRIVNNSWKNAMGENTSAQWFPPKVSLAPLARSVDGDIQIPVGSVADYYGFPTQQAIPNDVLCACNDLKFRGYLEIYNNYFRDQNYQPPIAYSKLNVYEGFLKPLGTSVPYSVDGSTSIPQSQAPDGTVGGGAIKKELLGSDGSTSSGDITVGMRTTDWSALAQPLRANKLHDYFTSVLPSPQKGEQVVIGLGESAPIISNSPFMLIGEQSGATVNLYTGDKATAQNQIGDMRLRTTWGDTQMYENFKYYSGLQVDLENASGVSINDLRMSAAIQQVYEILGRGGSRYTEYINSFFGLDINNPYDDIPTCLGHIRRDLDLYQTAQTSASTDESAQGSLAAFGYTSTGGKLFTRTFLEHGYVHIMAVVRHRNIYPALLSRDNFRMEQMDFYQYPLANIGEQPVYTREINPFAGNEQVFGYQEAWAEYRMEPDRVSGLMRTGNDGSLYISQWTYADNFNPDLLIADGQWLESNTDSVIARGTAFLPNEDEATTPQFKAKFSFKITKERPMPTYSMSGLDII